LGLLFKDPEDAVKGTNVIEQYGIIRYEPSANKLNQDTEDDEKPSIPGIHKIPHYDLENYKKILILLKMVKKFFIPRKFMALMPDMFFRMEKCIVDLEQNGKRIQMILI